MLGEQKLIQRHCYEHRVTGIDENVVPSGHLADGFWTSIADLVLRRPV